MISVVIPHYPINEEVEKYLDTCVKSLSHYDELILVVNDGIGFAKAVNRGMKLAKGDYIMVVNNDIRWKAGYLRDLCVKNTVTSPKINSYERDFSGCFFCVPRSVYEQIGGLDEQFEIGYYEDDDYLMRIQEAGIKTACVTTCNIDTEGGRTMQYFDKYKLIENNKAKFEAKWQK